VTDKTEQLTAAEIAKLDSIPNFNALQQSVIAARKRTGLRVSTSVGTGRYFVQVLAFRVGSNGKITGGASSRELASFAVSDVQSAIRFIEAI